MEANAMDELCAGLSQEDIEVSGASCFNTVRSEPYLSH